MITDVTTKYKKIFRNQVGKLILFSIFLFFFSLSIFTVRFTSGVSSCLMKTCILSP